MEKIVGANKNKFLRMLENPLLAGSAVLFIGNMIANVANYLYHLLMGRMLGPSDYGILESLISLLYLLEIPLMTLGVVIVKYVSQFKGEERYKAIGKHYHKINRQFLLFGIVGLIGYIIFIPLLAKILRLDNYLWLVMIGLLVFVTIFSGINRSVLQGLSKFFELSLSGVVECISKLLLSIVFLLIGLKVAGAIGAMLIAGVLGYFLSKYFVKDKVKEHDPSENIGRHALIKYSFPVFVSMLSLTSLFSTDIILARYYLSGFDAGLYSALAVLGKIIYFVSGPIGMVMFPLISEYRAKKENYRKVFLQSIAMVGLACVVISSIYIIAPNFIISMLYGKDYLQAASSLGLFAIFLSLYSLVSLFINYYISINKYSQSLLVFPAAIMQIVLIVFFHQNINQLVWMSIIVLGLLTLLLMIYYLRYGKEK